MKVTCERCEQMVIRRQVGASHSCFDGLAAKLFRVERSLNHYSSKFEYQAEKKERYENVINNVTKKMLNLNRRLEKLLFSSTFS